MTEEKTYHKICNQCRIEKIMTAFSINQYGKNNRILRRPVCIECYSKKKKINPKDRREYEKKKPKTRVRKKLEMSNM